MFFSSSHVWMWELDSKAECWRPDAFELWCCRRLLRVPWTARRSNQSILKEISPECSLEGLMLRLQYLATWCEELTHWKTSRCWERLKARGVGDDRGWNGWMASLTRWAWVWASSRSWWWRRKPGVLQSIGSQSRTWLSNWTELMEAEVSWTTMGFTGHTENSGCYPKNNRRPSKSCKSEPSKIWGTC